MIKLSHRESRSKTIRLGIICVVGVLICVISEIETATTSSPDTNTQTGSTESTGVPATTPVPTWCIGNNTWKWFDKDPLGCACPAYYLDTGTQCMHQNWIIGFAGGGSALVILSLIMVIIWQAIEKSYLESAATTAGVAAMGDMEKSSLGSETVEAEAENKTKPDPQSTANKPEPDQNHNSSDNGEPVQARYTASPTEMPQGNPVSVKPESETLIHHQPFDRNNRMSSRREDGDLYEDVDKYYSGDGVLKPVHGSIDGDDRWGSRAPVIAPREQARHFDRSKREVPQPAVHDNQAFEREDSLREAPRSPIPSSPNQDGRYDVRTEVTLVDLLRSDTYKNFTPRLDHIDPQADYAIKRPKITMNFNKGMENGQAAEISEDRGDNVYAVAHPYSKSITRNW